MGQYLEALAQPLAEWVELHLFVPQHFEGDTGKAQIHRFRTGQSRREALVRLLDPRAGLRVWHQVRALGPDLVHLFNGEGYPWAPIWAYRAEREELPLLLTLHDPEPHPGNPWEWINARLRGFVLRRAQGVHVHSLRFVEVAEAQGARAVAVIPHGSLAPRFLRYRQEGIRHEPLALFFGRLETYKGIDLLVEASLRLQGRLRVAIAGPGELSEPVLNTLRSRPDIFELHNGFLSEAEVALLFQRASVCVLPYKQATQSSVPLIAAAFGVPVVATELGGFVEDVPQVGGLLVPPGEPEALAQGMLKALGHKPVYPVELEFSRVASKFIEWYKGYGRT